MSKKPETFHIIRHYNSPNMAEYRGVRVVRKEKIYVPEYQEFVVTAPDSEHFVFEVPQSLGRDSSYRCSCGAAAVIVGANDYKRYASPTNSGRMMLCLNYLTFGQHATGGSRWI